MQSIAFPAVSAGIFGFPSHRCAEVMLQTAIEYLCNRNAVQRVVFCQYCEDNYRIFASELQLQLPEATDQETRP